MERRFVCLRPLNSKEENNAKRRANDFGQSPSRVDWSISLGLFVHRSS
jgi:hypothetical protein